MSTFPIWFCTTSLDTLESPPEIQPIMLTTPLLNAPLLALLARVRHTNRIVIADAMFPHWPDIPEIDLALIAGQPSVPDVLRAIRSVWKPGGVWMASEFLERNPPSILSEFHAALDGPEPVWEPHIDFKRRVPGAIGIVRTGEMRVYANIVLSSE